MFWLFLGMAFSGISARLVLLAHRGGFFLQHEAQKSMATVVLEIVGFLAGVGAFIVSFLLFQWWLPLAALALGYWVIAPFVVSRSTFPIVWQGKGFLTVGAITCSVMLLNKYFQLI